MHNLRINCVELGDKTWINPGVFRNIGSLEKLACGIHSLVHFFCSFFPDILHRLSTKITSVILGFFTVSTALIKSTVKDNSSFKYIVGGVA